MKPERSLINVTSPPAVKTSTEPIKDILKCSKNFYRMVENYTKDLKESVYHGAVLSVLVVGYTMLGKTLIKISPPSL